MPGSCSRPVTSFSMDAPASMAAPATPLRHVSTETGSPHDSTTALTPATALSLSTSSETQVSRYGAVDIPPTSM